MYIGVYLSHSLMKTQELCTAFHYIWIHKRKRRSPLDRDADVLRRFVRSMDSDGGCRVLQTCDVPTPNFFPGVVGAKFFLVLTDTGIFRMLYLWKILNKVHSK